MAMTHGKVLGCSERHSMSAGSSSNFEPAHAVCRACKGCAVAPLEGSL